MGAWPYSCALSNGVPHLQLLSFCSSWLTSFTFEHPGSGNRWRKNLIQAIHQQFQNALQLCCFRHLQSNLEHHLQEKKVPMSLIQLYVQDVFGSDSQEGIHFEGLVDCHSEEDFQSKLTRLQPVWDQMICQSVMSRIFMDGLLSSKLKISSKEHSEKHVRRQDSGAHPNLITPIPMKQ